MSVKVRVRLPATPADQRQAARQPTIVGHVFWDDALRVLDAQFTDAADFERLIKARPTFRHIVAAFSRRTGPGAAA